jgi:septum formation protein
LILASQSPRRRELLSILGVPYTVIAADIDETPMDGETAGSYAMRIALEKASKVAAGVEQSVVLAADTVVTIDDRILGKPVDSEDAVRTLSRLAGRKHAVYTAVCVVDQPGRQTLEGIEKTDVWFGPLSETEIRDYIGREYVLDKAGAYAIQGFASTFIPRIEGNYSNVIGLPLPLVFRLLRQAGAI